jgi:hypothetical protein
MITTGKGIPVEFMVTAGSIHHNIIFQTMDINLPKNGDLYDAATKKNSMVRNTWAKELENRYYQIHAVTAKRFLLKILCFIITYMLEKQLSV